MSFSSSSLDLNSDEASEDYLAKDFKPTEKGKKISMISIPRITNMPNNVLYEQNTFKRRMRMSHNPNMNLTERLNHLDTTNHYHHSIQRK